MLAFIFRVYSVGENFQFYGDQIRDWKISSGSFLSLPLVGTPNVGGGVSLGPIHYYLLWVIQNIAKLVDYPLPHYAGYGYGFIESISIGFLLYSLSKTGLSNLSLGAFFLFTFFSPYAACLGSHLAWNPGLAISFQNISYGFIFLGFYKKNRIQLFTGIIFSWLATQSHISNLLIFFTLLAAVLFYLYQWESRNRFFLISLFILLSILFLQFPYIIYLFNSESSSTSMIYETLRKIMSLEKIFSVEKGYRFILTGIRYYFGMDLLYVSKILPPVFFTGIIVLFMKKKYKEIFLFLCPVGGGIFFYSNLPIPLDIYWLSTLVTCLGLLLLFSVLSLFEQKTILMPLLFFLFSISLFPFRIQKMPLEKFEHYGTLIKGLKSIRESRKSIRKISTEFESSKTDVIYIYELLAGQVDGNSKTIAIVSSNGVVVFLENQ